MWKSNKQETVKQKLISMKKGQNKSVKYEISKENET